MANEQNLIPMNRRTPRERREISRKGAMAANKKRKEKKRYREIAEIMLSAKVNDKKLLDEMAQYGIEAADVKAATLFGIIKACAAGSPAAFDRLMELTGEKAENARTSIIEKLDRVLSDIDIIADKHKK